MVNLFLLLASNDVVELFTFFPPKKNEKNEKK